jgi:hypothetical protein
MARKSPASLTVIGSASAPGPPPPGRLGQSGTSLWGDIVAAYEFSDRASYETLFQACTAADRAEACRAQIDRDGELISTNTGSREHPLLKHEIAARSFVVRTLARLGLDLEPVRPGPGRPPGR